MGLSIPTLKWLKKEVKRKSGSLFEPRVVLAEEGGRRRAVEREREKKRREEMDRLE